jgi:hypothetical protein
MDDAVSTWLSSMKSIACTESLKWRARKKGDCIIIDESQFVTSARRWNEAEQKNLIDLLSSLRSKGFVIFYIALDPSMVDSIIRKFTLTYRITVNERGIGILYEALPPSISGKFLYPKRRGKITLKVPDYEKCQDPRCIQGRGCQYLWGNPRCQTIRARYERRKETLINMKSKEQENKQSKTESLSDKVLLDMVLPWLHEIPANKRGDIDKAIQQMEIRDRLDIEIGRVKAENFARWLQFKGHWKP